MDGRNRSLLATPLVRASSQHHFTADLHKGTQYPLLRAGWIPSEFQNRSGRNGETGVSTYSLDTKTCPSYWSEPLY
jgi:hypothetical protein